jgi:hypothetical protein
MGQEGTLYCVALVLPTIDIAEANQQEDFVLLSTQVLATLHLKIRHMKSFAAGSGSRPDLDVVRA